VIVPSELLSLTTESTYQNLQVYQNHEDITSGDDRALHCSLLVPLQPNGTGTTVIFCPSFRNTAICYQDLARQLAPDLPTFSFNWPQPTADNPPADTLPSIAGEFLQDLKTRVPHGPFIIGGYCFGAVIALEMAKQLSASGEQITLLVLIDPVRPSSGNQWQRWKLRQRHSLRLLRYHGIRFFIRSQYRRAIAMIQYLHSGTKERLEQQFHTAQRRAFYHYQARPSPHRALLVFSHAEQQEDEKERFRHEEDRWKEILPHGREILILPGSSHHTILSAAAGKIAERIRAISGESKNTG
jgi:thioesterase domain-containing protein